ncbi:putative sperm motility kinase W isoform X2 [Oryctolagus cuniculus]|uniref:putative sperm motility kinase W isoform X2 n=1 Tax=Oryctolagus cuniculus TaxID=9986 RepID=UPI00387A2C9C
MEDSLDFHPPLDGFRFVDVIGRGGFGLVKLARHLASGKYMAVKILLRDGSPSCPLSAQGEADILRSLRHDNIVRLLEERHAGKHLFLVMELATKGSLQSYVFEQGGLAEAEARTLFGQALAAVSYCHGQRVAHRDLKLGNLLLDEHMTIKLADFGLSLRLEQGTLVRGFWGTPEYCAPEVFLGEDYDALKADVWSLGVVLFAMLAAALPFHGKDTDKLRDRVLCGWYALPRAVSPALQDLLSWLLTVNASRRPSAEDARTHWWFSPSREAAEEDEEDEEDEEGAVTLLQPLGVPRDPEAREYLEGLGLLPGTGTEGSPGPRPHGPASLPKSSQSGEHHPIEDNDLSVVSVSCDSMAVDVSSTQSDSSKASSQPQQQWSPAPSAAPDSSEASSESCPPPASGNPGAEPRVPEVSPLLTLSYQASHSSSGALLPAPPPSQPPRHRPPAPVPGALLPAQPPTPPRPPASHSSSGAQLPVPPLTPPTPPASHSSSGAQLPAPPPSQPPRHRPPAPVPAALLPAQPPTPPRPPASHSSSGAQLPAPPLTPPRPPASHSSSGALLPAPPPSQPPRRHPPAPVPGALLPVPPLTPPRPPASHSSSGALLPAPPQSQPPRRRPPAPVPGALLPAQPPTPLRSPASHSSSGALLPVPPPSQPPRRRPPAPVPGAVGTLQSQKPLQQPVSLMGLGPQPLQPPLTPQPAPRARGRAGAGWAGGSSASC